MKNLLKSFIQKERIKSVLQSGRILVIWGFLIGVLIIYLSHSFFIADDLIKVKQKFDLNSKELEKLESQIEKRIFLDECFKDQFNRVLEHQKIKDGYCERQLEQSLEKEEWMSFFQIIPQASANYENTSFKKLKIKWKKPPFKIYSKLKDECFKQDVKNKKHCIKVWLSIAYAESSWKDNHTPFGLQSEDKSFKKWVSSYKKYWYKAKDGSFFYWKNWKAWKSHYCLSEDSSWIKWWCPNWLKNFNSIFYNISL